MPSSGLRTGFQQQRKNLHFHGSRQEKAKYLFKHIKINSLYRISLVMQKQQVFACMHPTSSTIFKVSNLEQREEGIKKEL
jgi:hypothetical protein